VKIFCKIGDDDAVIVGYACSQRGRVRAIAIRRGELCAVRLKDVRLRDELLPEDLRAHTNVALLRPEKAHKKSGAPDAS